MNVLTHSHLTNVPSCGSCECNQQEFGEFDEDSMSLNWNFLKTTYHFLKRRPHRAKWNWNKFKLIILHSNIQFLLTLCRFCCILLRLFFKSFQRFFNCCGFRRCHFSSLSEAQIIEIFLKNRTKSSIKLVACCQQKITLPKKHRAQII